MDATYKELARRAVQLLENSHRYRVVIVLIGTPGSGKSTVLAKVCDLINEQFPQSTTTLESLEDQLPVELPQLDTFLASLPTEPPLDQDIEDQHFQLYKRVLGQDRVEILGKGGEHTRITITQPTSTNSTETGHPFATVVPMDGFHLTREQLRSFKDPETLVFRRGSPFTFDNVNLGNLATVLRATMDGNCTPKELSSVTHALPTVQIPDFSHELKDPVPEGISIPSESRILIMEGLYLLLQDDGWSCISEALAPGKCKQGSNRCNELDLFVNDEHGAIVVGEGPSEGLSEGQDVEFWKLHVLAEENLMRVARRHLQSGIVADLQQGAERFQLNDAVNGEYLLGHSRRCDVHIHSVEEGRG